MPSRELGERLQDIYFQVDLSIIWETVQSDLPALYSTLKELIQC